MLQKIVPFLWFDGDAEAAANFYVSMFANSRIVDVVRYGDAGPGPVGSVMTVAFELEGLPFTALNGGPQYRFSPAVSFVVHCENQGEVDRLWDAMLDGGEALMCGWITDRFGVTWQIIPTVLLTLLRDKDAPKARRVTEAMLQMRKIDIAALERAAAG